MKQIIFAVLILIIFNCPSASALSFEAVKMNTHRYVIDSDPRLIDAYVQILPLGLLMGTMILNPLDEKDMSEMVLQKQPKLQGADLKAKQDEMKKRVLELRRREQRFTSMMGQIKDSQNEGVLKNIQNLSQVQDFVNETFRKSLWTSTDLLSASRGRGLSHVSDRAQCLASAKKILAQFLYRYETYASYSRPRVLRTAKAFQLPETQEEQAKDLIPFSRAFNDLRAGQGFPCSEFYEAEVADVLNHLQLNLYQNEHDQLILLDQLERLSDHHVNEYLKFVRWAFDDAPDRMARYFWQKANQVVDFSATAECLLEDWGDELVALRPTLKNLLADWKRTHLK